MGFMRDEAIRLIREKWKDPNGLAEELYAIFTGDQTIVIDAPVQITAPVDSNQPALQVRQLGNSDQIIQMQRLQPPNLSGLQQDEKSKDDPSSPDFNYSQFLLDLGNFTFSVVFGNGDLLTFDNVDPQDLRGVDPKKGKKKSGGGGVPAKVISGIGADYVVNVYPDGVDADPTTVNAKQLQIATGATIPADTWTIATQIGDIYYIIVPVWLEDLPA